MVIQSTYISNMASRRHVHAWPRHSVQQSGFSMVEVLVSIVVLSFGLLGMVGMQSAALKANREARLQSSAVVLARELAELIRSNNKIGILTGSSNPYLGSFSTSPLTPNSAVYCLGVANTACADDTAIANAEMTEWLARVGTELPGARVDVCFDAAPFDSSGLPRWSCSAGTSGIVVVKIGWTRGATDRSKSGSAAFEKATIPAIVYPVTAGNTL